MQVDDPALSFSMHALSGIMGMLFVGLLGKEDYIVQVSMVGGDAHAWVVRVTQCT